jgi:adenosylhomocysteine nucleosidase
MVLYPCEDKEVYMSIHILGAMRDELSAIDTSLPTIQMGIGKVNASIAMSRLLAQGIGPTDIVLVVGTAAAADPALSIGDVVISTHAGFHDVDVTALGFLPGQVPYDPLLDFQSDDELGRLAKKTCTDLDIPFQMGRVLSGDQFVANPSDVHRIRKTFNASCIEMETAAVAQTLFKDRETAAARWLAIRVISDLADKSAAVDFPTFLPQAAQKISKIVSHLVNQLD